MNPDDFVTITLTGVTATGHHGVFAAERRDGQPFIVDAVLLVRRVEVTDDLTTTVDYGEVATTIVSLIEGDPHDLIETLATEIAGTLASQPGVLEAKVTVHKPQAPIAVPFADVSVTVTRSNR